MGDSNPASALDVRDLLSALDAAKARYEELRTRWINSDGELCQTLAKAIGGFPFLRDCPEIGGSAADGDKLLIPTETVEVLIDMLIEKFKVAPTKSGNQQQIAIAQDWPRHKQ